jgi:hypothetical protein
MAADFFKRAKTSAHPAWLINKWHPACSISPQHSPDHYFNFLHS